MSFDIGRMIPARRASDQEKDPPDARIAGTAGSGRDVEYVWSKGAPRWLKMSPPQVAGPATTATAPLREWAPEDRFPIPARSKYSPPKYRGPCCRVRATSPGTPPLPTWTNKATAWCFAGEPTTGCASRVMRTKSAMFPCALYAYLHICGTPWAGNEYTPDQVPVWTMRYSPPAEPPANNPRP